ncbi:hypothetical protein GCM10008915_36450 [Bifidobacterium pullorum subsp. gallinarum]
MMRFQEGIYTKDNWFAGFQDFGAWLSQEQRKCVPRGPCGQDVLTTSGARGLMAKYPTFYDAYRAWKEAVDSGEDDAN